QLNKRQGNLKAGRASGASATPTDAAPITGSPMSPGVVEVAFITGARLASSITQLLRVHPSPAASWLGTARCRTYQPQSSHPAPQSALASCAKIRLRSVQSLHRHG